MAESELKYLEPTARAYYRYEARRIIETVELEDAVELFIELLVFRAQIERECEQLEAISEERDALAKERDVISEERDELQEKVGDLEVEIKEMRAQNG